MSTQLSPQFESSAAVALSASQLSASGIGATSAHAAPVASAQSAARGLSWVDKLTLAAIGVVVVVVTLPVLRGFGVRENERDALRMLRVLAAEPAPGSAAGAAARARPGSLAALAHSDPVLHRRLEDLEALPDGRLRRHGYLFDVSELAGEPMLRAWPWEHAQTGRGAFVWTPRRGLLGHPNGDGRYSGAYAAPEAGDVLAGGWVVMPRR